MLPDGWRQLPLDELVASLDAGVSVNAEDRPVQSNEAGVLKISAVTSGTFDDSQNKVIRPAELGRAAINPSADRILVSRCNTEALVGASAYVADHFPNLYLPDKLWQLEPAKQNPPHMRWLSFWLASQATREKLSKVATGTSGSMKNITKEQLLALDVPVPPVLEQRRIASVLSTWDQAIATTESLLANSRKQDEVLTNALLQGKKRIGDYQGWTSKKLADLIVESRFQGSGGDVARKITVKLYGRGVVGKSEKRLGSESTQYYRRTAGQFIYSKLDFLNGAFGRIPEHLDGYESTLDLPAFDFLPGVDPRWFLYFVSREDFYMSHLGLANGGRKARRVNPSDLLRVSIQMPELAEQTVIADVLDLALAEINNFARQLRLLREQKAALMAQLLTGKRRVNVDGLSEVAA